MQTISIAICDDNANDASELSRLIRQSSISADIHTYENTDVFLTTFKPGFFQLVFMDICFTNMGPGEIDAGIEAAVKIREKDPDVWLAFTTFSPDYAVFGYKVKADRYLMKPLDETEVLALLQRADHHFAELNEEIFVTVGRRRRGFRPRDIRYVEANNKQSVVYLKDETIVTYTTVDEFEKLLRRPSFLRCHRSYIVNMDYIEKAERDFLMTGGGKVYIGHANQWKVRKAYRDYIMRLARSEQ